jgi:acid phosphatase family membrane protein YuiD
MIPIFAWAISQLIKVTIKLIWKKRITLRDFIASGGMPSSHSALVCALAAVIAIIEGFDSILFGVVTIFALVVMYDATGVRQSVSKQSIVLNRIVKELLVGLVMVIYYWDVRENVTDSTTF